MYPKKTLKGIQSWLIEQERSAVAVGTTLDIMSQNLCSLQTEKHNNNGAINTFTLLSPFPAKFIGRARGNNTNGKGNCTPAI